MDRNTAREAIRTRHRSTRRGRWAFQGLVAIFGLSLLVGGGGGPAGASLAPDLFEITDANITGGSASKPDWGFVFGPGGQVKNAGAVEAQGFLPDPISSDDLASPPCLPGRKGDPTVLAGLASDKNGDPLNGMTWSSGSVPAKNDLTNVYAAGKRDPDTGALFIYFGLDRAETSGSNHVDFEFFKSPVALQATGTDSNGCPSGTFTGSRTPGDFLISVDFDNGGVVGNPEVRKWDGSKYVVVSNVPASDVGIVQNGAAIACGEWDCRDRDGSVIDTLPQNAFIEGFLNTAAVGFDGCLSTVTAHTRSSPSFTAELKDFAITSFHTCDANIQITPDGVNEIGDPHELTGHVNVRPNTGFVNAPQGTKIDFEIVEGPGTLSAPSCDTVGTTGSCPVVLTSGQPGITKVNATTTVNVGGVILTRETDGTGNNSGPATKRWVDANVQITPDGVNEVGDAHVFTVTVGTSASGTTPTFKITPAVTPDPNSLTSTCGTPTVNAGTATCTVTINSPTPDVFTANVTAEVTFDHPSGSAIVTRTTNGQGSNSGPAVKRYVDASVQITPDDVNAVGDPHVFTITAQAQPSGASPVAFEITPEVDPTPTTEATTCGAPTVIGNTATCTVTINSTFADTFVAKATAKVTMGTKTVTRTTNGQGANSGPATKHYVDASVRISPNDVNEVGDPHVFTVTATALPSGTTPVSFAISTTVNPVPGSSTSTCGTPTVTNNVATCTLTINSSAAGTFTANATAKVTMGGVEVTRTTDGSGANSGPATKRYVDARIAITPSGVNEIGDPHPVSATVQVTNAAGAFVAAPDGTTVDFDVTSGLGTLTPPSCTTSAGSCGSVLSSSTPGVSVVAASTTVNVGGLDLTRTTNGTDGNSNPITKRWVDAAISITPDGVNAVGDAHVFDIEVTATSSGATPTFAISTDVQPVPGSQVSTCNNPTVTGNTATCTLTINSQTAGTFVAQAATQVTFTDGAFSDSVLRLTDGTANNSGPATKRYVTAAIDIATDGVNEVGDPHTVTGTVKVTDPAGNLVAAPDGTTIDFDVTSGPGSLSAPSCDTAGGTGSCSVTLTSSTAGVSVVNASSTVDVGGVNVPLTTNGLAGNSGPLTKRWVDASVEITPDGVNEVGDPHVFTVTAHAVPSGASPVSFVITPGVSPTPGTLGSTCASPTVVGNTATCTITINSPTADVFTANATAKVTMGGVEVTRTTNGQGANSGPAVKRYVDAAVSITPDGVNALDDPHTFTVTATATPSGATPVSFVISTSVSPAPGSQSSTCANPTVTGNTATCTLTINSQAAGTFVANATAEVTMGTVTVTRTTDGTGANSGPATKRYVSGTLTIATDGVNEIGDPHTVTGTVRVTDPAGNLVAAPDGTKIDFAITSGPGGLSAPSCDTAGGTGSCSVTLTSATAGVTVVSASTTVDVAGVAVPLTTNGQSGNSGPLTKRWVDASVEIAPDGVNEVGDAHVFTVTATAVPSGATPVSFDLSTSVSPAPGSQSSTCGTPTVSGNTATCTLTINSPTAGVFTANATAEVTMGGVTVTRTTDGSASNSGPATKRYVDASVEIGPDDVNGIGEPHVFTVTATAVPSGATPVSFDLSTSVSPAPGSQSSTCGTPTVSGNTATCTLTINSDAAGTFTANATAEVTMGGTAVTRTTNGSASNSGPATKEYVSGSLNWLKHDEEGQPLGGATFEVCRTHTYNSASDDFDDTADVCVSVTDNVAPDVDTDDGLFKLEGLVLGRYTVEETKAPLGFKIDPAVRSIDLTTDAPNGTLLDPWVDPALQPAIQIVKTASPENGPPRDVTYTYVVTNIGEVRLENILVTDDVLGTIGTIPGLDPGESATLTTTVAVDETSPVRNVATACGDPVVEGQIVGPEVCDDDDAVISVVLGTRVVRLPRTGLPLRMMTLLAAVLVWLGTAFLGTQDRLIVARRRRDP